MAVKQQDIARHLGVSRPWVARALGDDPRISQETRLRVREVANRLGYRPNAAAQALVRGRANMVAVWSAYLHLPIYTRYMTHLQAVANAAGSQALIQDALNDPGRINWPLDGIICIDAPDCVRDYRAANPGSSIPIVSMGVLECAEVDRVVIDFEIGTMQALDRLVERGCRKIAYLIPSHALYQSDEGRMVAYRRMLAHTKTPERLIVAGDMSAAAAHEAVLSHVREHGRPDGILIFLSCMAMGAVRALDEIGARVPGDVALATVDDSPDLPYFTPSLSAVEVPVELAVTEAWRLLRHRLENPEAPLQRVALPTRFNQRESSR